MDKRHYPAEEKIGQGLREQRLKRGIMLKFVAQEIGVSQQMLAMLEAGQRRWTAKTVAAFEKAIGLRTGGASLSLKPSPIPGV